MRQGLADSEYRLDFGRALVWAVRVGVMLVALMPLIVTESTLFPYIVGKAIYARAVIELTFALWLLLIFYYPQHRLPRSWVLGAFGLWLAVSLLAAFTGVSLTRSLWSTYERMQGLVDLAHWFAFTLMAASVFRTFAHWRLLFSFNALTGMLVALAGISHYYSVFGFGLLLGADNRLQSTLGNPGYTSSYLIISVLISLGLIVHSLIDEPERNQRVSAAASRLPRRRRRQLEREGASRSSFDWLPPLQVFWLSSIMLNLWAIWLTGTRGGLITLVIVAAVFSIPYLIWGHIRVVRLLCVVIVAMAGVALAVFVILRTGLALPFDIQEDPTLDRIATIGLDDPSISGRVNALNAGYSAFLARPMLGWGPENFITPWGLYVLEASVSRELFDNAHNKLIEESATKGIVGLASYLLLWFAMMRALILSIARGRGHEQVALFIFAMAMTTYFIQNLSSFDTPVGLMQFCLLAAFAVAAERGFEDRNGRASGWLPSGWSSRLRFGGASAALRSSWGAIALSLCVTAIAVAAVALLNVRMYSAAAGSAQFLGATGSEWDARVARFNESVAAFPELGEFPRIFLMSEATRIYDSLSDREIREAAELFERELEAQQELEPQNWRLLITLAEFYQTASACVWGDLSRACDPEYLGKAREHIESARALAPKVVEDSYLYRDQGYIERGEALP